MSGSARYVHTLRLLRTARVIIPACRLTSGVLAFVDTLSCSFSADVVWHCERIFRSVWRKTVVADALVNKSILDIISTGN